MARRRKHHKGKHEMFGGGRHKVMAKGVNMSGRAPVGFHGSNPRKQRKMA
jgi:hypothetical protein